MASANFPEKGAQARRKVDGLLGEIYAVDPSKDLLTVRWRTATGFLTQVCTSEHFGRDWELTATTFNLPRVPLASPEALTRQLDLERQRYLLKAGGLLFICAIVLFIVYSILTPGSKTVQPNNNSQTPANSQSPAPAGDFYSIAVPPGTITLTAEQLETAYKTKGVILTNKDKAAFAAADALYKGKPLLVSGEADSSVYEDEDKNIQGGFKSASDELAGVQVSFRFEEKSKLANLLDRDNITVLCKGDGVAGSVPQLTDCLLKSRVPGVTSLLSDQIKATLTSDGVKLDKYSYYSGTVNCDINTGDWFTVGPADLRNHLSHPLRSLYALANKFPQIQVIDVMLESPAAPEKNEHVHDLPAGIANDTHIRIDAGDFRKFPKDFDWDGYPVYVANRYMTWVNWSIEGVWKSELQDEIRQGGFQEH